jgi:riboflavin synthase
MFTGIVQELGQVENISRRRNISLIEIVGKQVSEEARIGDSIAVNGVCLTVVSNDRRVMAFEAMPQTLKVTNLGLLRLKDKVNLEPSLKVGDRLSGHFVTGHVDCIGIIRSKRFISGNLSFEISVPTQYIKYCIPKGSICVDGISLTLVENKSSTFNVYIIPHTFKSTTLGFKGPSDKVNIEFDILAKQAAAK